jgi:hypothetical protein
MIRGEIVNIIIIIVKQNVLENPSYHKLFRNLIVNSSL